MQQNETTLLRPKESDSSFEHCPVCGEPLEKIVTVKDMALIAKLTGKEYTAFKAGDRISRMCRCQREAESEEYNRRSREAAKIRRVKALREKGIADDDALHMTFANDDSPDSTASKVARSYVRNFETMLEKNAGILFTGGVGTGKTFYAACIVNALIDEGIPAVMTSLRKIIQLPFDGVDAAMRNLMDADLVVFDDVGSERDTSFATERAFDAVDARIKARKPIIVTTNLSPQELSNAKSIREKRIYDRILGSCAVVPLTGASRRAKEQESKTELILKILQEE